jgi:membrane protein implicated in regulation of membrane protease activity
MKTIADVFIFILIMVGFVVAGLLTTTGSWSNLITWTLFAAGAALETWLLKMIYASGSRKDDHPG